MTDEFPENPEPPVPDGVRLSSLIKDDTQYFLLAFQENRDTPIKEVAQILAFDYAVFPESMGVRIYTFTGAILFVREYFAFSVQKIQQDNARTWLDNQQNAFLNGEGQWPITRL